MGVIGVEVVPGEAQLGLGMALEPGACREYSLQGVGECAHQGDSPDRAARTAQSARCSASLRPRAEYRVTRA